MLLARVRRGDGQLSLGLGVATRSHSVRHGLDESEWAQLLEVFQCDGVIRAGARAG